MDEALRLRMVLQEGPGGETRLLLTGAVEPVPQAQEVRRFLALLVGWTDGPVELALCVDAARGGAWCDAWVDALELAEDGHLEVRFVPALEGVDGAPR